MFRPMRRSKQELSPADTDAVLHHCTNGVLTVNGEDGYPYGVPVSYAWHDGRICFHSAKAGHKIDALLRDPRVSFTVIDEDTIVSAEYTTYFRSVILFGTVRITEGDERIEAFQALVEKYSGDRPGEEKAREIAACSTAHILVIDVDHLTGKEAIEYVRAKKA